MLAYALHAKLSGSFLTFTLPSLVKQLEEKLANLNLGQEEKLELGALLWMLTDNRPQGFVPGRQYNLTCCLVDGVYMAKFNRSEFPTSSVEWYSATLSTARSSEMEHCCQEFFDENNMVLGVTCPVHGDRSCGFKCVATSTSMGWEL